jgi:hypothetical protein
MKFDIPKIVRPLGLAEYDKALEGLTLHVWVNPPMTVRQTLVDIGTAFAAALKQDVPDGAAPDVEAEIVQQATEALYAGRVGWLAEILSQGPEATHMQRDELEAKRQEDPAFIEWLMRRIGRMMLEHQSAEKKG